ncbi:MAG TPA: transglutaminase-like domain-containing protein, partial [Chitinophagaceae bacterium]|nr:transglutaminase-like domain-containing protein [Chitinophagaceae bacterium]
FMDSWPVVSKQLLNDEDFGLQLRKDNGWLNDVMKAATGGAGSEADKARNIYNWVRDNFTCTNYNRKYLEQPLKNLLKSKNGNEAEINLLLTAMLLKADLKADPVMLSTRSHGYAHAVYPLMER